ncbi:hypothetical protein RJ639_009084 [Escallonia herrerae]|uniref:B box-type domain-containing protein n=1 Tax=Escallonia herrerae TaxID=1293975 RepID=A0AA88VUQ8_9ASTE|nr:hypothetical protein RJ639_009084 [Escallonia herrerae]
MKRCELCNSIARMYCESDQASLCWDCDARIHSANFLVAKHLRTLLCHSFRAIKHLKERREQDEQTHGNSPEAELKSMINCEAMILRQNLQWSLMVYLLTNSPASYDNARILSDGETSVSFSAWEQLSLLVCLCFQCSWLKFVLKVYMMNTLPSLVQRASLDECEADHRASEGLCEQPAAVVWQLLAASGGVGNDPSSAMVADVTRVDWWQQMVVQREVMAVGGGSSLWNLPTNIMQMSTYMALEPNHT